MAGYKLSHTKEEVDALLTKAKSAVMHTPQELTEEQKAQARKNIGAAAGEALVVGTAFADKCANFSELFNGSDTVESFVFFTDPHLIEGDNTDKQMREYLNTLKKYYSATPTSFVICGGDWLGNSDTQREACFKLGFIDGQMRDLVSEYYPVIGNHDTNYQGVSEEGAEQSSGTLTNETIRNLMNRNEDALYYAFDGKNTKFYVFDTGSDWATAMTEYRWEQIAWLAERLVSDDVINSAIVLHIGSGTFAQNIYSLCNAYNQAGTITLNDVTYDFSGCTGKVRFALAGHTHQDSVEVINGITVITTTHMRDGSTPTFDLCMIDYDNDVLHMIRVGNGVDRAVDLSSGTTTIIQPDVLLRLGLARTGSHLYPVSSRAVYVSTAPCYNNSPATQYDQFDYEGVEWDDYYAITIPSGATRVTITCPSSVKWAYLAGSSTNSVFSSDSSYFRDSGWQTPGGGTIDILESEVWCIILFHDNNGTDMTVEGYDTSEYSITFE